MKKDLLRRAVGSNLKHFRFAVSFGTNFSPAILNQCVLKHIEASRSEIAQELSSPSYVDVLLEGNNADDLVRQYAEPQMLFSKLRTKGWITKLKV